MKISFIKKTVVGGLLALTMLFSTIFAALPVMAAPPAPTDPATMSLDDASVTAGAEFDVNLNIGSIIELRGFQAEVRFDPAMLEAVAVGGYVITHGTYFPGSSGAVYSGGIATINNSTGVVSSIFGNLEGNPGVGVAGSGVLATIRFRVKAGVDGVVTPITVSETGSWRAIVNDTQLVPAEIYPTIDNGMVTIGTPSQPDLAISNVVVTGVTGDLSNYDVSFRINNIGDLDAGASIATIVVESGTPIEIPVDPIIAGDYADVATSSPILISGTIDAFIITADADGDVAESNETNNSASDSYSYVPTTGATTDVDGTIAGTLSFTQPSAVDFGVLDLGWNSVVGSMNVVSNQSWAVNVHGNAPTPAGGVDGKMTKWDGTTYSAYVKLHDAIYTTATGGYLGAPPDPMMAPPANYEVHMTGADQLLANGIPEGQAPNGIDGETRNVSFAQYILGSDAALSTGYSYHIVLSFLASSTAW